MKKLLLVLGVLFVVLTFVGAGYMLINKGRSTLGTLLSLWCLLLFFCSPTGKISKANEHTLRN
jgi:hypothetical protein